MPGSDCRAPAQLGELSRIADLDQITIARPPTSIFGTRNRRQTQHPFNGCH
jgi:hypothetical protein